MARACWRIRLQEATNRAIAKNLGRPLKAMLGLDEDESRALVKKLPFELVVHTASESETNRMQERLSALGFEASVEPVRVASSPCRRHSRLAVSELCQKCGTARICTICAKLSANPGCDKCSRSAERWTTFRRVRIGVLLAIFAVVASTTYLDTRRVNSWKRTLVVGLYPIADDEAASRLLPGLLATDFQSVGEFFDREAERYGVMLKPVVEINVGPAIKEHPPSPPAEETRSWFDVVVWSLRFRWWVFRTVRAQGLAPADIRIFAIYHSPVPGKVLEHSLGLEKGHVGVVHLFAMETQREPNNVVIAHELLHTAGATDKYDQSGVPIYPSGYASPDLVPRFPQLFAEIMAGRIPIADGLAKMPAGLSQCLVGPKTAAEIGWTK